MFKELLSLIAILPVSVAFSTSAMADDITGTYLVESGSAYIKYMSPESGDVVIYTLNPNRPVGKKVAKVCYPSLECRIDKLKSKDSASNNPAWQEASAVFEIVAGEPSLAAPDAIYEKSAKTRFGIVAITDDNQIVIDRKKRIAQLDSADGLNIVGVFENESKDMVLLQQSTGNACPALFSVITLSKSGAVISPQFGTCSDIYNLSLSNNALVLRTIDIEKSQSGKKGLIEYTVNGSKVLEKKINLP